PPPARRAAPRPTARRPSPRDRGGPSRTARIRPVAGATVALDLSGTIDVPAERKRLTKDLEAAQKEKAQATGKLGNEAFLAKAPDNVVDKIRGRLAKAEADIERIGAQLAALPQS
ncbi:valine--tRNA ligase, partial [Streptomyces griseus]